MKTENMRVRVNYIWRDIKDFNCTHDKFDMIASNDDKFEFDRTQDLKDVAMVISMSDLFALVGDTVTKTATTSPKKSTKKKEVLSENTNETEGKTED